MSVVQLHRVGAEPHRAAHVVDLLLLRQQVDHGVGRLGIELGRVRAVHADHVAREVDDRELHAEADAEERDAALARDPRGVDLALDAAHAEAAGDQDAVRLARAARAPSCSSSVSESTQKTSILVPWWKPAWRSASTTDR